MYISIDYKRSMLTYSCIKVSGINRGRAKD